jgi:Skp family chaperone for outer membrane proteins
MIKKILLFAFLILSFTSTAQKAQKIGYIDMEYILENIPEYQEALKKINAKSIDWQRDIEKQQQEIDDEKTELSNEKVLLTTDLIVEKEEDIQIKELELKKRQASYFGTEGDLYFLRKQLVKPIQDLVYNAIQDIATKRKYDFVLDKSSNLIMLYSNSAYDISDMVITSISRAKKVNAFEEKLEDQKNKKPANNKDPNAVSAAEQKKMDEREAKKAELQQKIEDQKAEKLRKREELKKEIEAKRLKRIEEIEAAKKNK